MKTKAAVGLSILIIALGVWVVTGPDVGDEIDSFNGISVYHNGFQTSSHGRSLAPDGYNLGQKYQCVEYIKRYYHKYYNHKMPETYGHAKDFFDGRVADGALNSARGLTQYTNPGASKPQTGDILVLKGGYGHVGIVTSVENKKLEIIQQNTFKSRRTFKLIESEGRWMVDNDRVAGWLRM